MNNITMKMNADELILQALREDITSEDITTNSVMPCYQAGEVDLICKQDGVIAGLDVFSGFLSFWMKRHRLPSIARMAIL